MSSVELCRYKVRITRTARHGTSSPTGDRQEPPGTSATTAINDRRPAKTLLRTHAGIHSRVRACVRATATTMILHSFCTAVNYLWRVSRRRSVSLIKLFRAVSRPLLYCHHQLQQPHRLRHAIEFNSARLGMPAVAFCTAIWQVTADVE